MVKKATAKATEIAVKEENNSLATALFFLKDTNFETLNGTIEKLGEMSGELDESGKNAATRVIDSWQQSVVSRLQQKSYNLGYLLNFFGINTMAYYSGKLSDQHKAVLAAKTGTVKQYEKILEMEEQLKDLELESVYYYVNDPDLSINANALAESDVKKAQWLHKTAVEKIEREIKKAERAWTNTMKKNEEVRALIKTSQVHYDAVESLRSECASKAAMARLGINVSSQAVRDLLKELLDFEKTV